MRNSDLLESPSNTAGSLPTNRRFDDNDVNDVNDVDDRQSNSWRHRSHHVHFGIHRPAERRHVDSLKPAQLTLIRLHPRMQSGKYKIFNKYLFQEKYSLYVQLGFCGMLYYPVATGRNLGFLVNNLVYQNKCNFDSIFRILELLKQIFVNIDQLELKILIDFSSEKSVRRTKRILRTCPLPTSSSWRTKF